MSDNGDIVPEFRITYPPLPTKMVGGQRYQFQHSPYGEIRSNSLIATMEGGRGNGNSLGHVTSGIIPIL